MVGIGHAGQWTGDAVLDCEGDFVGEGWELVLGYRDGLDGIDGG